MIKPYNLSNIKQVCQNSRFFFNKQHLIKQKKSTGVHLSEWAEFVSVDDEVSPKKYVNMNQVIIKKKHPAHISHKQGIIDFTKRIISAKEPT